MKKNWPYFLLLALVLFVLFRASQSNRNKHIDWRENYTSQSKAPFGTNVSRQFLEDLMNDSLTEVNKTAYVQLAGKKFSKHNYIFVNDIFSPTATDVLQLCRFASEGNSVFISARSFGLLSDTLKVQTDDALFVDYDPDTNITVSTMMQNGTEFIEANLTSPTLHLKENAVFDHTQYGSVFAQFDTAHTLVLGTNGKKLANYVRIKMGKGEFLLHTVPDAFANYYAANRPTAKYLFGTLSYLPAQSTFLDAYYKTGRTENTDTRRYIMSEPALRLAYYILIIAGIIGLFFGGKRRQRPVPVLAPPTNSTLEFVEQVGVLYYRQGNHMDIAAKKINYFLESIRSRFYVQTTSFNDIFLERISNLSGIPKDKVHHLFATIDYLRTTAGCTEKDLRNLEELIRDFNKQSKR